GGRACAPPSGRAGTTRDSGTPSRRSSYASSPGPAPEPKIELHVHLEGAVRPATLRANSKRNDYALPGALGSLYRFRNFSHFIEVWILTTNALRTAEDFRQVVADYADEAASHGAVYLEAIFSPAERVARGVDWDEIFSGYCDGAQEARELHGVEVRLTPDIFRGATAEQAEHVVRYSAKYRERGVVAVGLSRWGAAEGRRTTRGTRRSRPSHSRSRWASPRSRMRERSPGLPRCAERSRLSERTGCATASAQSRIRASSPSSRDAAPSSTSARSRTSAPAPSPRSQSIRCHSSSPRGIAARFRPTTPRCSTPT